METTERAMERSTGRASYEIVEQLGVLSSGKNGEKRICRISWNGAKPKLDVRFWRQNETGTHTPNKGVTLTRDEAVLLRDILNEYLSD